MTEQLLTFSRKEKERREPVYLHNLINEVVNFLEHSIDKQISVKTGFEAEHPIILGDHSQLGNAILNIAINAKDAMPNGGILLVVLVAGVFLFIKNKKSAKRFTRSRKATITIRS